MSETEAPFYESIDEILAPPSQTWINRGSGLLLGIFLLLAGVAAVVSYQEEMQGTAYIQALSVTVLSTPPQPVTIGWIRPGDNGRLRKGDALLVLLSPVSADTLRSPVSADTLRSPVSADTLRSPVSADTLRSPMDGELRWLRILQTGAILEPNLPLCRIEGTPGRYRLKIAFPGIDSLGNYIGKKISIRPGNADGMHFRPWETEIISQPYLDPQLGVLVMDAQPPAGQNAAKTPETASRLPALAPAYLVTGKKSFLSFLLGIK
jgi:hypothetical protein